MTQEQIRAYFAGERDVRIQLAAEGDGSPELAWGDTFISLQRADAPPATMPFATLLTKDYPGFDEASRLAPGQRFRLNLDLGRETFERLLGFAPRDLDAHRARFDFTAVDQLLPHPAYGKQGWVSVVNPGQACTPAASELLRLALERARQRSGG